MSEVTTLPLLEMSLPKQAIIRRVEALEPQINTHLMKVIAVTSPNATPDHWRSELRGWFRSIGRFTWKNTGKPMPPKFYFDILYDGIFGDTADRNITSMLRDLQEDGYEVVSNIKAIDVLLREFYRQASARLSDGKSCDGLINGLGTFR